jgi:hypothetical protein
MTNKEMILRIADGLRSATPEQDGVIVAKLAETQADILVYLADQAEESDAFKLGARFAALTTLESVLHGVR